jgi:hypothetical protein
MAPAAAAPTAAAAAAAAEEERQARPNAAAAHNWSLPRHDVIFAIARTVGALVGLSAFALLAILIIIGKALIVATAKKVGLGFVVLLFLFWFGVVSGKWKIKRDIVFTALDLWREKKKKKKKKRSEQRTSSVALAFVLDDQASKRMKRREKCVDCKRTLSRISQRE